MGKPMSGLTVIELAIWVQGPLAGQLMADLGARVIKIEHPGHGDFSRGLRTLYGASMMTEDGRALLWELCNRGKESVCIDLRRAEGREALLRLVAGADVFVTNLRPETLAAFRCTAADLRAVNPTLIYARGAGLTINGPLAEVPAQDTTAMAHSGFMQTAGAPDGQPTYPPGAIADVSAGTSLAFGVLAALLGRERGTDSPRDVTTTLVQAMAWAQLLGIGVPANTGERLKPFEHGNYTNPLMGIYRAGDDRWLALGIVTLSNTMWRKTCEAIGTLDWFETTEWGHSYQNRLRDSALITAALQETFATRPAAEWIARLRQLDLPCSLVNHPAELAADEGIQADRLIATARDGFRFLTGPFTLSDHSPSETLAPPLGQDTWAVLAQNGYSEEQIAALFEAGIAS